MAQGILITEKKKQFQSLGYSTKKKLSFNIDGGIKVFQDKQKLKQYMNTKPQLQEILRGILHTEYENKHNHKRMEVLNLMRRRDK
jgi:hypothetical protein